MLTRLIYIAFNHLNPMKTISVVLLKSALFILPGILMLFIYEFGLSLDDLPKIKVGTSMSQLATREKATSTGVMAPVMPEISPFKNLLDPIHSKPVKLQVAKVGLDLIVDPIGVEADGTLGVPKDWYSAGWYKKSSKPGQHGNVIIDGHFDTNTGTPAAFWNLKNLNISDKVVVVDEFGKKHEYTVEEIVHVDIKQEGRLDILNKSSGKTLTLITCGGMWDIAAGTYNTRLIIKAKIIEDLKVAGKPA